MRKMDEQMDQFYQVCKGYIDKWIPKYANSENSENVQLEALKYLVSLGVDISTRNNLSSFVETSCFATTLVRLASSYGQLEVVKYTKNMSQ